jgi:hypothetical protein
MCSRVRAQLTRRMRWNGALSWGLRGGYGLRASQAKGKQALPTRLAATAGDIIYFEWDVPFAPVRSPCRP